MRKAYVLAAVLLAVVPGPRGQVTDPLALLLRPADVAGARVHQAARPFPEPVLLPCDRDAATSLPEARAATVGLTAADGFVTQAVFVFPTERAARERFRAHRSALAGCPTVTRAVSVDGGGDYELEVRREPMPAPRYGDESLAYVEDMTVPGIGAQPSRNVLARAGGVILLVNVSRNGPDVHTVATAAVEAASGR